MMGYPAQPDTESNPELRSAISGQPNTAISSRTWVKLSSKLHRDSRNNIAWTFSVTVVYQARINN